MKKKIAIFLSSSLMVNSSVYGINTFANAKGENINVSSVVEGNDNANVVAVDVNNLEDDNVEDVDTENDNIENKDVEENDIRDGFEENKNIKNADINNDNLENSNAEDGSAKGSLKNDENVKDSNLKDSDKENKDIEDSNTKNSNEKNEDSDDINTENSNKENNDTDNEEKVNSNGTNTSEKTNDDIVSNSALDVKLNLSTNVVGDVIEFNLDDGNIKIYSDKYEVIDDDGNSIEYPVDTSNYVIMQGDSTTTNSHTITVESGSNTITLKGVNMQSSTTAPISITTTGETTLLIDGENTVKTTASDNAGIEKNGDSTGKLIIDKVNEDKTDVLNAGSTSDGAAIGSKKSETLQNIYINGGTINASCTGFAAGIGSGIYKSASYIYINGGIVTTSSRMQGAGIGGGAYGEGHHIYINGGTVTAKGGMTGSGIGAGGAAKGSYIYINGGSVYAKGQTGAQDIGGGSNNYTGVMSDDNKLDNVLNNEIDNQVVYLYKINGLTDGEAITIDDNEMVVPEQHSEGDTYRYFYLTKESHKIVTDDFVINLALDDTTGEFAQTIDEFDLTKGSITITSTGFILNGKEFDYTGDYKIKQSNNEIPTTNTISVESGNHNVTLSGVNIETTTSSPLTISPYPYIDVNLFIDGENTLKSTADGYAGIQKQNSDSKLIIDKVTNDEIDKLIVIGGNQAAGIGTNANMITKNISICGGTIIAQGGSQAAGIGCGYNGEITDIYIKGGIITATGGENAAGIGSGDFGNIRNIYIDAGTTTAIGGKNAAGIGSGRQSSLRNIYISGGNIKAIGDIANGAENIGDGVDSRGFDVIYNNATDNTPVYEVLVYTDDIPTQLDIKTDTTNTYTYGIDDVYLFDKDGKKYFTVYLPANDKTSGSYSTINCNGTEYKVQVNADGNASVVTAISLPQSLLSITGLTYGDNLMPQTAAGVQADVSGSDTKENISNFEYKVKKDSGEFESIGENAMAEMANYTYQVNLSKENFIFDKNIILPSNYSLSQDGKTITYTSDAITTSKIIITELPIPVIDELTYSNNRKLSDIVFDNVDNGSWQWIDDTEIPTVTKTQYAAKFVPNNLDNTDYTNVIGWSDSDNVIYANIPISVVAKKLNDENVSLEYVTTEYNGSAKKPSVTVTDGNITLIENTDYEINYGENINAGNGSVTVIFKGNYGGSLEKTFEITKKQLGDENVAIEYTTTEYDGSSKQPLVAVTDGSKVLAENVDYEIVYSENVNAGNGKVTVTFIGNYSGSSEKIFEITRKQLGSGNVAIEYTTTEYSGLAKEPKVSVTDGNITLTKNVDYTVAYSENTNVGTGKVSIKFIGNYDGNDEKTFEITAKVLDSSNVQLEYSEVEYSGLAKEPQVTITDGNIVLVENVDYDIVYSDNVTVGTGKVSITFKCNYAGNTKKHLQ